MHPRFSPFTLNYHEKDKNKAVVFNSKGDRAYTFKLRDLELEIAGTNFELSDPTTYSIVCSLSPALLWKELQDTIEPHSPTTISDNGPYRIVIDNKETKNISFQGKNGTVWTSSLSTDTTQGTRR